MVTDYGVRRDDVAGYAGIARRSIFIVDRGGDIRWTWVSSRETPQPDYDAVMTEAKQIASAG
jgi:peroxiredoxin